MLTKLTATLKLILMVGYMWMICSSGLMWVVYFKFVLCVGLVQGVNSKIERLKKVNDI